MAETLQDTLDDREKAHEAKYKLDQERQFKAHARRNKLLGLWAAERMGMGEAESEAYAKEVVILEMSNPGEGGVLRKVSEDFRERGVEVPDKEIAERMERLYARALEEIGDEYPEPLAGDHSPVGG